MKKVSIPNIIDISGRPAIISYEPDINAFKGIFVGLPGYCEFTSDSIQGLKEEGEIALQRYISDRSKAAARKTPSAAPKNKLRGYILRYLEHCCSLAH